MEIKIGDMFTHGDYVLSPYRNAFNEKISYWISKRNHIASLYAFTPSNDCDLAYHTSELSWNAYISYFENYTSNDLHKADTPVLGPMVKILSGSVRLSDPCDTILGVALMRKYGLHAEGNEKGMVSVNGVISCNRFAELLKNLQEDNVLRKYGDYGSDTYKEYAFRYVRLIPDEKLDPKNWKERLETECTIKYDGLI